MEPASFVEPDAPPPVDDPGAAWAAPAAVEPAVGGLPTGGWTVPAAPVEPRIRRPIQGRKVMLGGGLALGGHAVALIATFVIAYTGSVYGSTWLVVVALEALLFLACLVGGIVWVAARDRGIGIGLLIGWPVGLLVPVVVIGFYVLGMMAPINAVFRAELP